MKVTDEGKPSTPAQAAQGTVASRRSRWMRAFRTGALGMGAEILFTCGLILIGFAISLLSGW